MADTELKKLKIGSRGVDGIDFLTVRKIRNFMQFIRDLNSYSWRDQPTTTVIVYEYSTAT